MTALLVYEHKDIGSHWDITKAIQKIEKRTRYAVPSFTDLDEGDNQAYITIQKMVGRFKSRAKTILENVCDGRFP